MRTVDKAVPNEPKQPKKADRARIRVQMLNKHDSLQARSNRTSRKRGLLRLF